MKPIYIPNFLSNPDLVKSQLMCLSWLEETPARKEYFMSDPPGISYTYGNAVVFRTYISQPYDDSVNELRKQLDSTYNTNYKEIENIDPKNPAILRDELERSLAVSLRDCYYFTTKDLHFLAIPIATHSWQEILNYNLFSNVKNANYNTLEFVRDNISILNRIHKQKTFL